MFRAMERGELTAVYCIGENPATSEADRKHAVELLRGLDTLIVQDIFMTKTAELADVVFPASNSAFESEGTVTNSERRVQRVRAALQPPGNAKDDVWIIEQLANRMGAGWGEVTPREAWDELRSLSPMHAGMSWERLEELGGIQWPCPDESHPGELFLHSRLWAFDDPDEQGAEGAVLDRGRRAAGRRARPTSSRCGSRPDGGWTRTTPGCRRGLHLAACDAARRSTSRPRTPARLGLAEDECVAVSSRRGSVEVPVHVDQALRPGLVFMTFHFPDQVDTNVLTIEATDPKSGTAEFKATAVRIDKLPADEPAGSVAGGGGE